MVRYRKNSVQRREAPVYLYWVASNNRNVFSPSSGGQKSKIMLSHNLSGSCSFWRLQALLDLWLCNSNLVSIFTWTPPLCSVSSGSYKDISLDLDSTWIYSRVFSIQDALLISAKTLCPNTVIFRVPRDLEMDLSFGDHR